MKCFWWGFLFILFYYFLIRPYRLKILSKSKQIRLARSGRVEAAIEIQKVWAQCICFITILLTVLHFRSRPAETSQATMAFATITWSQPHLYRPMRLANPKLTVQCSSLRTYSTKFDLRTYWTTLIAEINQKLDEAITVQYPEKIYEAMRYSVLAQGAKRAPPVMCVAACELFGGSRLAAFPTACALEMVRSFNSNSSFIAFSLSSIFILNFKLSSSGLIPPIHRGIFHFFQVNSRSHWSNYMCLRLSSVKEVIPRSVIKGRSFEYTLIKTTYFWLVKMRYWLLDTGESFFCYICGLNILSLIEATTCVIEYVYSMTLTS